MYSYKKIRIKFISQISGAEAYSSVFFQTIATEAMEVDSVAGGVGRGHVDVPLGADHALLEHEVSARPHHVGSAMGRENAEFMAELLASWGFETEIAEYRILLPTP